jgi:hypothetical protein
VVENEEWEAVAPDDEMRIVNGMLIPGNWKVFVSRHQGNQYRIQNDNYVFSAKTEFATYFFARFPKAAEKACEPRKAMLTCKTCRRSFSSKVDKSKHVYCAQEERNRWEVIGPEDDRRLIGYLLVPADCDVLLQERQV